MFLLAVQIPAWRRLSRRPSAWKDAEILLLRHQLAVLQRLTAARPRLTWTDRALFAALLTLIPRSRHGALHSFITPGTILLWHRDIVRRRWAARSRPKKPGRQGQDVVATSMPRWVLNGSGVRAISSVA